MKISIDKPCSESWENMQENFSGKFCAKCRETVEDFTSSTPEEIAQKLSEDKKVCGRFTSSQLEQNYALPWVKIMITALLMSGAITSVDAQKIDSLFQKSNEQDPPPAILALSKKIPLTINKTQNNSNNDSYDIVLGHPRRNDDVSSLILIDGVVSTEKILKQIPTEMIKTVTTLLSLQATALYKEKGKNGAIIITTKK